jgi:hypothetical protein
MKLEKLAVKLATLFPEAVEWVGQFRRPRHPAGLSFSEICETPSPGVELTNGDQPGMRLRKK